MKKRISITIDDDTLARLVKLVRDTRDNVSAYINRLLNQELNK